ncbi:hypothetical protein SASPL_112729 [Salvia splendens]|uniref:Plant methyltransferase dimerisation domain-containing protein n=1 Tax=Salvia splendens TaxID=180675 RepID=A0A8X9A3J7_SALSN|nr:hypothetical protein SASPL_112729 [Salvia splendens]
MSTTEEEMRTIAIQYASGAVVPMVVKAAIELDLFQLDRLLRLLTAHSILSCSLREGGDERCYALSEKLLYKE